MVDVESKVCCMCGDVGFPDNIFRCINCHNRFQHSYCSSYYIYSDSSGLPELCDWCQTEVTRTTKPGGSTKKSSLKISDGNRSRYSGSKMKHEDGTSDDQRGKSVCRSSTPKTTTRRYKLLKDVMC